MLPTLTPDEMSRLVEQLMVVVTEARPEELILVRHGETESNRAQAMSKIGDDSLITPEFRKRPTDFVRLTPKGVEQAKIAGSWLKENVNIAEISRGYVSFLPRTWETASYMSLGLRWRKDVRLNERSWGDMDVATEAERLQKYAKSLQRKEVDPLGWRPPNGDSMYGKVNHCWMFLQTVYREFSGKRLVVVCHGEVIWAFRVILERIDAVRYRELFRRNDTFEHVHNCQIIRYLRTNPETGEKSRVFGWKQSTCPWDLSLSRNTFEKIVRPEFSDNDLLTMAESFPRLNPEGGK